ncbi:MAG: ORF6N domain-containing protein [Bacteroidales bacterium]|nr:ORF6N domain-containing protein [Bacteroidales bacterium]
MVMTDEIKIYTTEEVESLIYHVRGVQVMLDADLAAIYGYSTKAFNQQIKNNIERFDEDFMFQLTETELQNLRSKILTSSWGGTRYRPYAFTEQGIYMLMTVLKGEIAVKQSKALVRIFKQMKDFVVENQSVIDKRDYLRLSLQTAENARDLIDIRSSLAELDDKVADAVAKIGDCVTQSELSNIMLDFSKPATKIGWLILNGQPVESDIAYQEIYSKAKHSIFIIDNYISLKTLVLFKDVAPKVEITVFSDNINKGLHQIEFNDFLAEYPSLKINLKTIGGTIHDRYIVTDYGKKTEKIYHCGSSSKDGGRKVSTITLVTDNAIYSPLIGQIVNNPQLVLN